MLPTLRTRLQQPRFRYAAYGLVGLGFFALALGTQALRAAAQQKPFDFVVSDGRGYYVYLPALLIEGTLDFTNQYRRHWGPDFRPALLTDRTARGFAKNKYPGGVALTLLPSFLPAHGLSRLLFATTGEACWSPDGYGLVYQLLNLAYVMVLGWFSLVMADRLLVGHFRVGPCAAALGVVAFWLGSPFAYYYFREPFMAHVVSAFWVMAVITLTNSVVEQLPQPARLAPRLSLLTFAFSMALVCRPTNLFLFPFLAYLGGRLIAAGLFPQTARSLPLIVLGLAPVAAQAAFWYTTTGRWLVDGYEGEYFDWAHPALAGTLFSSRHGLFFWSPLLLLSVAGFLWYGAARRGRRDPLWACYGASGLCLWYLNSSWHQWWFGDAFGGRAFLELAGFFVAGLVFLVEMTRTLQPRLRAALFSGMALAVGYNAVLMALYVGRLIPRGDYLF